MFRIKWLHCRLRHISCLYDVNVVEKSSAPPILSGAAAENYVARRHASRIRLAPAAKVAAARRRGLHPHKTPFQNVHTSQADPILRNKVPLFQLRSYNIQWHSCPTCHRYSI